MGLFSRKGRKGRDDDGPTPRQTAEILAEWISTHRGVEAYVEPRTAVTENTVLLVAHDGEFTRRTVPSPEVAKKFARSVGIPIYDATVVGYPQRMRDWSRKQTILRQRGEAER